MGQHDIASGSILLDLDGFEVTAAQRELFAATGIAPPPRVTSLQPA